MPRDATPEQLDLDRRSAVLRSALTTFARFGYRRTSMEQVALDAGVSRPGLYFLFSSKGSLFREAVEVSLAADLAAAERALADRSHTLHERLQAAFDCWAGRYIGPLTRDVATIREGNPDILGPIAAAAPRRFAELITAAISDDRGARVAKTVAPTLLSTSIGIKHQVLERGDYLEQLAVAIDLLLPP